MITVSKQDDQGTKCTLTACCIEDIGDTLPARFWDLQYPLWVFNADLFFEYDSPHPQKAYLLLYVYSYLTQGHEGNNDYVRTNPAATEIIRQGVGVYAT